MRKIALAIALGLLAIGVLFGMIFHSAIFGEPVIVDLAY